MTPNFKIAGTALGIVAGVISLSMPVIFSQPGYAETKPAEPKKKGSKTIDISANSMEIIKEQNRAIFIGKVDALRDGVKMRSDKLIADYSDVQQPDGTKKTEVRFLNATGNVVVITDKQHITSDWATMDVKKDTAVMGGKVVVTEEKSIIRGPKLFLNLKTGQSKMRGGRVKGVFFPQE